MSKRTYKLLLKTKRLGKVKLQNNDLILLSSNRYVEFETSGVDNDGCVMYTGYVSITERGLDYIEKYRSGRRTFLIALIGAITVVLALLVSILNTMKILQII